MTTIEKIKEEVASGKLAPMDAIDMAVIVTKNISQKDQMLIAQYTDVVSGYYGVTMAALAGSSRTEVIVKARKALVFILRKKGVNLKSITPVVSKCLNRGTVSKLWNLAQNDWATNTGVAADIRKML